MAHWEGYLECWKDCADRQDHRERLLDYLKKHEKYTKPETTKHLLSIGPGTGELDHGLVSLLPHLTLYTAVDPSVEALNMVKERLQEYPGIEKHYVNGVMETYTGPPCSADIILMSHVGYYFADSLKQQIGRALSWLNKEGGRILFLHSNTTVGTLITSRFDVHTDAFDLITAEDVRRHLVEMGANFAESEIAYTFDASYPGSTYYGFVSLILNRQATREEVEKALSIIHPAVDPGTGKVPSTQSLFVIENTSNTRDEDK